MARYSINNNMAGTKQAIAATYKTLVLVSAATATLTRAMIYDIDVLFEHVYRMVHLKKVKTISGKELPIKAETFCVHGDNLQAVTLIKKLRKNLEAKGIKVQ